MAIRNTYDTVADGDQLNEGYFNSLGIVPVGAVVAWLKTFTNTPALLGLFVECNGQVLSDGDSVYDGETIPDLNGSSGTERFLRGQTTSGGEGGSETHTHPFVATQSLSDSNANVSTVPRDNANTNTASTLPSYHEVVWIMRIK